jgi:hypothetical protein
MNANPNAHEVWSAGADFALKAALSALAPGSAGTGSAPAKGPTPGEARKRRNARARARYHALRDLGMVRTPYGWE